MSHPLVRPAASAAAVLATVLALTLGTATRSQAAGSWFLAPCATVQFAGMGATHGGFTALHGQVSGCEPHQAASSFAVVVFRPQDLFAAAYPESLVRYQPGGPTQFSGAVPASQLVGVCAMRSLTERITCVRVTWPKDGPATLEPIATTDPLVAARVYYEDSQPDPPVGYCGSCLEDPGPTSAGRHRVVD